MPDYSPSRNQRNIVVNGIPTTLRTYYSSSENKFYREITKGFEYPGQMARIQLDANGREIAGHFYDAAEAFDTCDECLDNMERFVLNR